VWFPWWLRHGAMDPFEGTLLGERGRTELWLYTFNLVIRLRKVKQSAIRFWTIFSRSCCPCHPWDTSANPPLLKWSCTEQPETCFYQKTGMVSTTWHSWIMDGSRLHAFRCGPLLFMVLCWGWTFRAPNSYEFEQPFNAHVWVWPTTVPSREYRTTLFLGTESVLTCLLFHFSSSTSSLFGP